MAAFTVGMRVSHREHGPGTVVARRFLRRVRVRFDGAPELPRTVREEQLELLPDEVLEEEVSADGDATALHGSSRKTRVSGASPTSEDAQTSAVSSAVARADLRQTIEALRMGVVPAQNVDRYTVGRRAECAAVEPLFEASRGFRLVWGEYGVGKTHFLDLLEQMALGRNFVAARLAVDPREVSLAHPKRLYQAVVAALRYPDGGRGLDPLMHRLVDSVEHRDPEGSRSSRFFSPYLHALEWHNEKAQADVRDWLGGGDVEIVALNARLRRIDWRGERLLTLSDFRTHGRMYGHMLGTLSSWAKDAGYAGLMILFDEIERIDALSRDDFRKAAEVMKYLAAISEDEGNLAFEPDRLYRGGHAVHRSLPLRFEEDQPLSVLFAITPLPEAQGVLSGILQDPSFVIPLQPLGARDLHALVARVVALYRDAYQGFEPSPETFESFIVELDDLIDAHALNPRAVVRETVFVLDRMRLSHSLPEPPQR